MYGTVDKQVEIYKVRVQSNIIEDFGISDLKQRNHRVRRLEFSEETATADKLPVHIILGAADIQRIKLTEPAILGPNLDTDQETEFTMLGWVIAGKAILSSA